MTDSGVREIQLTAKQLVFVFMAAVVFSVAVFLLGVSVGRSAGGDGAANPDQVATTEASVPPPTPSDPSGLTYHETLQKQPAGSAPPPDPSTPPPPPKPSQEAPATIAAETAATEKPATPPPPDPAPTTPPKPEPDATPPSPPATTVARPWFVQVASFRERPLAENLVRNLKRDGYAAQLVIVPGSLPNKVRVGPFSREADAQATRKRLAKHKPVIIRP